MSGKKGRSGRRAKPDEIRIAEGTYRKDLHGDPNTKPKPTGVPRRPRFTMPEASKFWDQYVPKLIELKVAKETDGPRLQMMCEAWALYRAAIRALKKNPLDKDARISYAEYARQFANAASEFGMNPSDRSRIIVDAPKKQGIQGRKRG